MKKQILPLLFLFLISSHLCAQKNDTAYFDEHNEDVATLSLADHYSVTSSDPNDSTILYKKVLDVATGRLLEESQYYRVNNRTYKNGIEHDWFKSGQLEREANYKLNLLEGEENTYWKTGKLRRKATYHKGELVSGKCYTEAGADTTFYPHEKQPSFEGGMKALHQFLSENIVYPTFAKKIHRQGKTVCQFIVDKDGSISKIWVLKSSGSIYLDDEAQRVIALMPKWQPGYREGKRVKVRFTLPVVFKLNDRNEE